ncbi:TonB family protein [Bacteroidota bacterium]|jgi:protein TonB|nr:TonB family protein [Bacteroidota bacterium]MEC7858838.1 TonB family protein [Pseudomonadota bacterium]|tara:strand:+ start:949 stop:1593 length:645 start_codon:yes stop_codon:yes gene_type:complete
MITVGNFVITRKHLFISGAPLAGFLLFLFMVALISTGDAGDVNKGRKIGNVIMPEREIETLLTDEIEPPQEPETAPPEIAPPQLDVTPIAVSATLNKPQINFNSGSGSMFRDGEYIPLFKVQPVYPRRAQERGTEGFVIVAFTITESGTITDPYVIEGKCRSVTNRGGDYNDCTMFNSATLRAALKLKYKPTVRDGRPVAVNDVPHKFTFELEE